MYFDPFAFRMPMWEAQFNSLINSFQFIRGFGEDNCVLRNHLNMRRPKLERLGIKNETRIERIRQFYTNYFGSGLLPVVGRILGPFVDQTDLFFTGFLPVGRRHIPGTDHDLRDWLLCCVLGLPARNPIRNIRTLRLAGFFSTFVSRRNLIRYLRRLFNTYFLDGTFRERNRMLVMIYFIRRLASDVFGVSTINVDSREWRSVYGVRFIAQEDILTWQYGPLVDLNLVDFTNLVQEFRGRYGGDFIEFEYDFPPPPGS
jgi:hypothetical protein